MLEFQESCSTLGKHAPPTRMEASGYLCPEEAAVLVPSCGSQLSRHASVHLKHSINGNLSTQPLALTPPVSTVEPTQLVKFNLLQKHRDLAQMPPPLVSLL